MSDRLLQKKETLQYNQAHNAVVTDLCNPLKTYLNVEWFFRGIIPLNAQQEGIGQQIIVTDTDFLDLYTLNFDTPIEGKPFAQAIREAPLHSYSYLLWSEENHCPLINMCRQKVGLIRGLTIYKRYPNHIMAWWFTSKNTADIPYIISQSSMQPFHEFIHYFETKLTMQKLVAPLVQYNLPFDASHNTSEQQKIEKLRSFFGTKKNLLEFEGCTVLLSKREWECLSFLSQGKTYKEIAKILSLSPRTIETYINSIKEKTGVSYKSKLIEYFIENKGICIISS